MGSIQSEAKIKRGSISAVVIRADGTVEDLGVVSYYHKNPLKRLVYKMTGKAMN